MKEKNKNVGTESMKNVGMDERAIIREQERLAKVAKRKKRKKWKILGIVLAVILIIVIIWYIGWGRSMLAANTEKATVKIEKSAGQTVVYARIDEINGNEITYTIAEEVEIEASDRTGDDGSDSFGGRGWGNFGGYDESGERPDRSDVQGNFSDFRNRGGMTGGTMTGTTDSGMIVYDGTTYRVGKETFTKYIPVGTDVTTKLGTVTTFSRLAAKDYVALVMDKDGDEEIIVAVYIIG